MADFKDMASHPEKSGNIARETLWKNTHQKAIMLRNLSAIFYLRCWRCPKRHSRHPTSTWLFFLFLSEFLLEPRPWSLLQWSALRASFQTNPFRSILFWDWWLVIWKGMESLMLEIWKLEIQSDKACKKNMDLLDMDRSQMGCLNEKISRKSRW